MDFDNSRDLVMYAAIFGVFAFAWYGWAQENPLKKMRVWLGLGAVISLVIASIGWYLAYVNWEAPSALNTEGAYELFGVIVATEITLALAGSLVLIKRKRSEYVSSWVAFIVAIHFIPLAIIFKDWTLNILAALLIIGIVAIQKMPTAKLKRNTLTCIFTASVLLIFAIRGLLEYFIQLS